MSVKPILFNTEMVRAILNGRKTVTRRAIKNTEPNLNSLFRKENPEVSDKQIIEKLRIPPYQPGDIIYVRETWFWNPCWDCGYDTEETRQCPEDAIRRYDANRKEHGCYCYKASMEKNEYPSVDTYHPSIHMPKEAARIWLKVTNVRVERLQDITDEQAKAEGANCKDGKNIGIEEKMSRTATDRFKEIWDSTIKKSDIDRYGWDANPWVWVIEFERCEKPEG
jgi:hypothetical protein